MKKITALTILSMLLLVLIFSLTSCQCEHQWIPADCTHPKTCSICGQIEEGTKLGHSSVYDSGKAATFTSSGLTEGAHCSRCGEVIKKQEIIPAKGETFIKELTTNPDSYESGTYTKTYYSSSFATSNDYIYPLLVNNCSITFLYNSNTYDLTIVCGSGDASSQIQTVAIKINVEHTAKQYNYLYSYKNYYGYYEDQIYGTFDAQTIGEQDKFTYTNYVNGSKSTGIVFDSFFERYQKEACDFTKQIVLLLDAFFKNKKIDLTSKYFNFGHVESWEEKQARIIEDSIKYLRFEKVGNSYSIVNCYMRGEIIIPSEYDGLPVTSIGDKAFQNKGITSIKIPNSVTSIGSYAFSGCSSLTSIEIPDSVTSIGDRAFDSCTNLFLVILPDNLKYLGKYAFSYCYDLFDIEIPYGIKSIEEGTFLDCKSLEEVIIPNSVTSIGKLAFCTCTQLKSITIPNSVTSIGRAAFRICEQLTSITIPNSVTFIDVLAFGDCYKLKSVTMSTRLKSISEQTFSNCTSLVSITIPSSVTSIGDYAFDGCKSLTSITIPSSVKSIGYCAFYTCKNLKTIIYKGTKDQWETINGRIWNYFGPANCSVNCTDGIISKK